MKKICFNFNLQMITNSDRFVLSGALWQQNKGTVKLATLNKEVNKISNELINQEDIINEYSLTSNIQVYSNAIRIRIDNILSGVDMTNVKAIALVLEDRPVVGYGNQRYFVIARNVDGLSDTEKSKRWEIEEAYTIGTTGTGTN